MNVLFLRWEFLVLFDNEKKVNFQKSKISTLTVSMNFILISEVIQLSNPLVSISPERTRNSFSK